MTCRISFCTDRRVIKGKISTQDLGHLHGIHTSASSHPGSSFHLRGYGRTLLRSAKHRASCCFLSARTFILVTPVLLFFHSITGIFIGRILNAFFTKGLGVAALSCHPAKNTLTEYGLYQIMPFSRACLGFPSKRKATAYWCT